MGAIYFPNNFEDTVPPSGTTSEGHLSHKRTHSATALTSLARKQSRTTTPVDAIEPNSDPLVRARWIYVVQWRLMILVGLLGRRSLKHALPCKTQLRKSTYCIANTALISALEHLKSPVTLTAACVPVLGKQGWWP
jgi:hypothetical protein